MYPLIMQSAEKPHSNRLAGEKSPYLQQHSSNPVDWHPWSAEALQKAKKEGKPLFVSIGYSSCHWCHVMERESFEDEATARIMNENFINIKVDREERPDIDAVYMKAVQAMTGGGGWPLSVFAAPDGTPFYGGTYFPPTDNHGLPSFKNVLIAVSSAYKKNRGEIDKFTYEIRGALFSRAAESAIAIDEEIPDIAFEAAKAFYDPLYGGFGSAPKFPHAMFLSFILKYSHRTKNAEALDMARKSLLAMANGGIYDHLGGGFHRYAVDSAWAIPHFEKMLYDNALMLELYCEAYAATRDEPFGRVALETAQYLLRDMKDALGGFYSAEDADSGGGEGAYYTWTVREIKAVLGGGGARFMECYRLTEEGNMDGRNTLRMNPEDGPGEAFLPKITEMKNTLFTERLKRPRPAVDKKIITAHNGLAVTALLSAGRALKRPEFSEAAGKCAGFILNELRDSSGRLYRYYLGGRAPALAGLADYALLGSALVSLFEATGEKKRLDQAVTLAGQMKELFYESKDGLFFDTGKDQEALFAPTRETHDTDVPSGNSAAAGFLLKLSLHADAEERRKLAQEILKSAQSLVQAPLNCGYFLCAVELFLTGR